MSPTSPSRRCSCCCARTSRSSSRAAWFFGWLFGKVGPAPVVGEILAGVILGPSLLGASVPGRDQDALTPETTAFLSAMAQVGSFS
jgi:Kef-type K+ transport system membrane component KefB